MKTTRCFLLLILLLCSCSVFIKQKTGIGRSMTHKTKTAYIQNIHELTGIRSDLLYLPDSTNRITFIREALVEKNRIPLFGIYVHGELISGSQSWNEKSGCAGRLINYIDSALSTDNANVKTTRSLSVLDDYSILPLVQSTRNDSAIAVKPITIVLVYSYGFGNFYNTFYRDVIQRVQPYEDRCRIYVITIDPLHILPD